MTQHHDSPELDALRSFRAQAAQVPAGLQERIEERIWQEVLVAEASVVHRRGVFSGRTRGWFVRQGALAAVAAALIVVMSFSGGKPTGGAPAQASVDPLDTAIRAIGGNGNQTTETTSLTSSVTDLPQSGVNIVSGDAVVFEAGDAVPVAAIAAGPAALTPEQILLLPDDEHALLAVLRAAGGQDDRHDPDFAPFQLGAQYVADRRIPISTRVAFVRMLRMLDGVGVGGSAVDVFGRPGVLVDRIDKTSRIQQYYLFDRQQGQLLEHRERLLAPSSPVCPAGTVIILEAFDNAGLLVDPQSIPYANWPDIEAACDPALQAP
jgi:hypothetical protein